MKWIIFTQSLHLASLVYYCRASVERLLNLYMKYDRENCISFKQSLPGCETSGNPEMLRKLGIIVCINCNTE